MESAAIRVEELTGSSEVEDKESVIRKVREMTSECLMDVVRMQNFKEATPESAHRILEKRYNVRQQIKDIGKFSKEHGLLSTDYLKEGIVAMLRISDSKNRLLTLDQCTDGMKPYYLNFSRGLQPSHKKALLRFATDVGITQDEVEREVNEWEPVPANVTPFTGGTKLR